MDHHTVVGDCQEPVGIVIGQCKSRRQELRAGAGYTPAAKVVQPAPPGLKLQQLAGGDVVKVKEVEEEDQPFSVGAEVIDPYVEELALLVADRGEPRSLGAGKYRHYVGSARCFLKDCD